MYTHTHREEYVFKMYKRLGIYRACDINEEWIAKQLHIYIKHIYRPSHFARDGRFKAILLDSRVDRKQRRMEFIHELGHILRSADGFNHLAPELRQYLEWDARHFEFYAAMPYEMMKEFDLNDPHVVCHLSDSFCVPESYVVRKLKFIREKEAQYELLTK